MLAVAMIAVLIFIGSAVTVLAVARTARHEAETAADLAALAGAVDVMTLAADPCGSAAAVAQANGALLTSCQVVGEEVRVVVSRPVSFGGLALGTASARARAGPVDAAPDGS